VGGPLAQAALSGEPCDDPEWVKSGYRSLDRATVEAALRRHVHPEQIRVTVGAPDGRDDEADADDDGDDDDGEDGGDG
jgi:hypothetical protein